MCMNVAAIHSCKSSFMSDMHVTFCQHHAQERPALWSRAWPHNASQCPVQPLSASQQLRLPRLTDSAGAPGTKSDPSPPCSLQSAHAVHGRPFKCWTDYVREDLTALGLTASWFGKAQDRDSWRDKIQELLGHTQQ